MRNPSTLFFSGGLLLCLLAWLPKAKAQISNPDEIDRLITRVADSANVPGLSLALIRNGRLFHAKGYGRVKRDSTQPVSTATVFDAASLSKPVFAYAVLQLVEEGVLDLDKPLFTYLPYPDIESDERYKTITARMVLSHTTGFPNWRGPKPLSIKAKPGSRFGYSGEGFVYLQKVVEKISGKPLNELMTERVFGPLGMVRSSYVWKDSFEDDYARPHDNFGFAESKGKPQKANAAYSLQTTAADFLAFLLAILQEKGLKRNTLDQMLSPQSPLPLRFGADTTLSPLLFWGLGFGLEKTPTGDYFWHWGDNGTYRCFVAGRRETGEAMVYFTNSFNGLGLIEELTTNLLGGAHPSAAFLNYDSYKAPNSMFARHLLEKGVSAALQPYLKDGKSTLVEGEMNWIGQQLLSRNWTKEALEVFRYNQEAYPGSAEAHYHFAYGNLRSGNLPQAMEHYRQTLVLKPDHSGKARQILTALTTVRPTDGTTQLILKNQPDARLVTLAGSFNDWDDLHTFFTRKGNDWVCNLPLQPGSYQYKIIVDGKWMTDPGNPETAKDKQGNTNSLLVIR